MAKYYPRTCPTHAPADMTISLGHECFQGIILLKKKSGDRPSSIRLLLKITSESCSLHPSLQSPPPPLVWYQSGGNHGSLQESRHYNVMFKSLKDPGEVPSPAFLGPKVLVVGLLSRPAGKRPREGPFWGVNLNASLLGKE